MDINKKMFELQRQINSELKSENPNPIRVMAMQENINTLEKLQSKQMQKTESGILLTVRNF